MKMRKKQEPEWDRKFGKKGPQRYGSRLWGGKKSARADAKEKRERKHTSCQEGRGGVSWRTYAIQGPVGNVFPAVHLDEM